AIPNIRWRAPLRHFPIIDVMLGGEGTSSETTRDLTEIEELAASDVSYGSASMCMPISLPMSGPERTLSPPTLSSACPPNPPASSHSLVRSVISTRQPRHNPRRSALVSRRRFAPSRRAQLVSFLILIFVLKGWVLKGGASVPASGLDPNHLSAPDDERPATAVPYSVRLNNGTANASVTSAKIDR